MQRSAGQFVAGRFAPTPNGPLHIGSLIAAVASRCDALARGGHWQLRIDDIDPPREQSGAAIGIQATLARFGLQPDGPVLLQSSRLDAYRAALRKLSRAGHLFLCDCTRRSLQGAQLHPGACYARTAASHLLPPLSRLPSASPNDALRLRITDATRVTDLIQGIHDVPGEDPVLQRRDGLVAYALASAVDDANVTRVVRGADLLDASGAQVAVLQKLGLRPPEWVHLPVAIDPQGKKLGKSTDARALDTLEPLLALQGVWEFLGQPALSVDTVAAFWREAPSRWSLARVPRVKEQPIAATYL